MRTELLHTVCRSYTLTREEPPQEHGPPRGEAVRHALRFQRKPPPSLAPGSDPPFFPCTVFFLDVRKSSSLFIRRPSSKPQESKQKRARQRWGKQAEQTQQPLPPPRLQENPPLLSDAVSCGAKAGAKNPYDAAFSLPSSSGIEVCPRFLTARCYSQKGSLGVERL